MGQIYGYARASRPTQDTKRQVINIKVLFPDADVREENFTGTTQDRPEWKALKKKLIRGTTCVFDEVSRMGRTGQETYDEYMELYKRGVRLIFLKDRHCDTDTYASAMQGAIIKVDVNSGNKAVDKLVNSITEALNTFMQEKVKTDILRAFEEAQHEVERLHIRTSNGMHSKGACNTYKTDDAGEYILDSKGKPIIEEYGSIAKSKLGKTVETRKAKECKAIIRKHCKKFGGSLSDVEVLKLCGCSRNAFYKYKSEVSGA